MLKHGSFTSPVAASGSSEFAVYQFTRTDIDATDKSFLDQVVAPAFGDIVTILTSLEGVNVDWVSYIYSEVEADWVKLTGEVSADKVILTEDITLAGNYTQVGNLTKTQSGTSTFATKGKSVAAAFTEIFSKRLQPSIAQSPTLGAFSFPGSTTVEAGTVLSNISIPATSLVPGAYTYGPSTGVQATEWRTFRIIDGTSTLLTGTTTGGSVTDTASHTMGDQSADVTRLQYRIEASYSAGVVAYDNLGDPSSPEIKIAANSTSRTSNNSVSAIRFYFTDTETSSANIPTSLTSEVIRTTYAPKASAATSGMKFSIAIPEGCRYVAFAYPATIRDVTVVADTGAFGTDIKGSFTKTTVAVAGANGYVPIDYKVFEYKPAAALGANTYDITL